MASKVPEGNRIYAVGDIHGRLDLLRQLHSRIFADAETAPGAKKIIYLGDYVDRGDQSWDVVEYLLSGPLDGFETVHLLGNHEQYLVEFLSDPELGSTWLFNGGDATLRSYGVDIEDPALGREGMSWLQRGLRENLPPDHKLFFQSLAESHTEGDYFFAHAGVCPGVALENQELQDLLWIRGIFLDSTEDFGKIVVHGHSVASRPEVRANRIGIDTGAYRSDCLTCLVLEGEDRRFIQT